MPVLLRYEVLSCRRRPLGLGAAIVYFRVGLSGELINEEPQKNTSKLRKIMQARSIITLCGFGAGAVVALKHPLLGLGLCICCLLLYLRPEPPGT